MENGKLKPGYHGVSHFDIDALEAIASEHDKRSETVSKKPIEGCIISAPA
jgi:hypothetical protein